MVRASPEPAAASRRPRRRRTGRSPPMPWRLPLALLAVGGFLAAPAPAAQPVGEASQAPAALPGSEASGPPAGLALGQAPGPAGPPGPPAPPAGRVPALRMPVAGAVVRGFELPAGPYGAGHRGIDIAAALGARARAPTAGQVVFAGPVAGRVWVTLRVAPGVLVTLGPLLRGTTVGRDRRVHRGAPVGQVDSGHGPPPPPVGAGPGPDTGATLHLSLRVDGVYVDPLPYLVDRPRARLAPLLVPGGRPAPAGRGYEVVSQPERAWEGKCHGGL
jgi:murein DD-endopeptidase MepM/ murein hydrolase activator NlpD